MAPAVNTLAGEGAYVMPELATGLPDGGEAPIRVGGGDGTERIAATIGVAALVILALMELGGFRAVVSVSAR